MPNSEAKLRAPTATLALRGCTARVHGADSAQSRRSLTRRPLTSWRIPPSPWSRRGVPVVRRQAVAGSRTRRPMGAPPIWFRHAVLPPPPPSLPRHCPQRQSPDRSARRAAPDSTSDSPRRSHVRDPRRRPVPSSFDSQRDRADRDALTGGGEVGCPSIRPHPLRKVRARARPGVLRVAAGPRGRSAR